jgi:PAS domain S-box-containing protein
MLTAPTIIKAAALLCYMVLALLTLRSKSDRTLRVFFSLYMFWMVYWQLTSLMVNLAKDAASALSWYNVLLAGSGTFIVLMQPLSRALLKLRTQRALTAAAYVTWVVMLAAPWLGLRFSSVVMGRGGYYKPVLDNPWFLVVVAVAYFFWGCGVFNLVRALVREKSPVQRNRVSYFLVGAGLVFVGALTNLTALQDYPVDISFNLASALLLGYAVVRHRLMDIRVIIARSLLYSVLTGTIIAGYLAIVFALERLLSSSIAYGGPLSGLVAILVLALVLLPLRNVIQRALDRVFFREKADYQKATQVFSREITALYDRGEILDLVVDVLGRTMKAGGVSVSILDEDHGSFVVAKTYGSFSNTGEALFAEESAVASWLLRTGSPLVPEEAAALSETRSLVEQTPWLLRSSEVSVVAPILLKDRLTGTVSLGQKRSGKLFNDEDLRFLTTIANQTATALEKSNVFGEMRRRLSEQTLLFVLSEKFRSSSDLETVMISVVQVLKSFLSCELCAIAHYGSEGGSKCYAQDPLSAAAAELASGARVAMQERAAQRMEAAPLSAEELAVIGGKATPEGALAALVYFPLQSGTEALGMLMLSRRTKRPRIDARERELLRTIASILAQGLTLYRTISHLVRLKTYNENILNSLNDMGDSLVILDTTGTILSVNRATCQMIGYTEEELVGQPIAFVAGSSEPLFTAEGLERLRLQGSISGTEMTYRTRGGSAVPVLFSGSVMAADDGTSREIVGVARDITAHLKAEEMSKNLLMVNEIHHRIKNNLQVISSLLYLQSMYVSEPRSREMFRESQNRVRSMALLHERLYLARSAAGVDFSDYVHDLIGNLFVTYGVQSGVVGLEVDIHNITLGMDTAVPCGLIINELVTNALKHAFGTDRPGKLGVSMRQIAAPAEGEAQHRWYTLSVWDDGKGFPGSLDFRNAKSLGLKLVSTLTGQLGGTIELARSPGTRFTITVKEA